MRLIERKLILILAILAGLGEGVAFAAEDRTEEALRVALFDDEGVLDSGLIRVFEQLNDARDVEPVRLNAEGVRAGGLGEFDVAVFSGGSGGRQSGALGEAGRRAVREFVEEGGGYVGICAGAYLACSGFDWGVGVLNARTVSPQWRRGKAESRWRFSREGR